MAYSRRISRRRRVQRQEIELSVGDAVKIGNCIITLIDIDGVEAAFRIDDIPLESSGLDSGDRSPPAK
jgi:hypothetical protein